VIFLETTDLNPATVAAKRAAFLNTWFGGYVPANLQIGAYSGGGVGLSTGGDAVNLYNAIGVLQASVTFGTSSGAPAFASFDNAAGLNSATISQLSAVGVNGTFNAANTFANQTETGSPGTINNAFPVAVTDPVTTAEDAAVTFNVLTNDTDANGDALTVTGFIAPGRGGLVNNGNGSFTYTPSADFNGGDTFSYTVTDSRGGTATGTVNITVTAVNDKPTADAKSISTAEDTGVAVTLTGSDVETSAASLIFTVTQAPAHGTLSGSGDNLVYTPNANYGGPDSFQYTVTDTGDGSDAALTSTAATVGITINAVADVPALAVAPAFGVQGSPVTLSTQAALSDTDGSEVLTITVSGVPTGAALSAGTNQGGGVWTLTPAQLSGLKLTGAGSGVFTLHVVATAMETSNTSTASAVVELPVSVAGSSLVNGVLHHPRHATGRPDRSRARQRQVPDRVRVFFARHSHADVQPERCDADRGAARRRQRRGRCG